MNAFWAAHVVHHQSEEFNLAVALRQGAFQGSFSWVFYLPLAWLGFPPLMFLTLSSFNTLYQFWIHTRAIGRLGPLEWVLNTPSNHRVHHGRNPKFAALLLIASVFLFNQETLTPASRAAVASAILASLLILGAMLDGRRWAVPAEVGRLAVGALAAVALIL